MVVVGLVVTQAQFTTMRLKPSKVFLSFIRDIFFEKMGTFKDFNIKWHALAKHVQNIKCHKESKLVCQAIWDGDVRRNIYD
jgi:hypothetical protein